MDSDWLKRWEAAEAQWVLSAAILIDLPTVATDAMVHGWDSQSLRLLTVASTGDDRDARDLFLAAVAELGRHLPTHSGAARRLVQFYAATIASGEVEPLHPCDQRRAPSREVYAIVPTPVGVTTSQRELASLECDPKRTILR